jgi:hypothetical protein
MRNAVAWLLLVSALGFALGSTVADWSFNRPPYVRHHPPAASQYDKQTVEDKPSLFFHLGVWADDWHDAIGAISAIGILLFTGVLTASTIALWVATRALEANKRCIVRGAGQRIRGTNIFQIEISNAGSASALIERVHFGFAPLNAWPVPPPYDPVPIVSGELIAAGMRTQLVGHVTIPSGPTGQTFFALVEYVDTQRGQPHEIVYVMNLIPRSLLLANLPFFIQAPPGPYAIDTFPVR